jgi:hypothetical protein
MEIDKRAYKVKLFIYNILWGYEEKEPHVINEDINMILEGEDLDQCRKDYQNLEEYIKVRTGAKSFNYELDEYF